MSFVFFQFFPTITSVNSKIDLKLWLDLRLEDAYFYLYFPVSVIMDAENVTLMHCLLPNEDLASFSANEEEAGKYMSYMSSCGVDHLTRQLECFPDEKEIILRDSKKLATENYKTFIKSSNCVAQINEKFSEIDEQLKLLNSKVPDFSAKLHCFNEDIGTILKQKRQNNQTLAKHNQLLEVLEITQLMDTCVRNHYYDEGLELCSYVRRLEKRLDHINVIKTIGVDVEKLKHVMLQQLFQQLKGNVQLPVCLKLIGYLRRMDVYAEDELRTKFLQARGAWLRNILKSVPNNDPYLHITKVIELNRIHLFDIVTQYRALFANEEQMFMVKLSSNQLRNIFNSWIIYKVKDFLETLRNDLHAGASSRIESVLNQAMYFGLSFSRIGADFRMLMLPIFAEVILRNVKQSLISTILSFKSILACYTFTGTAISENTIVQPISQVGTINPPAQLILYPPLSWLANEIIAILNDLRNCCPMTIENEIVNEFDLFVSELAGIFSKYFENEKSTMNAKEKTVFVSNCKALKEMLAPFVMKAPRLIFKPNCSDVALELIEEKFSALKNVLPSN